MHLPRCDTQLVSVSFDTVAIRGIYYRSFGGKEWTHGYYTSQSSLSTTSYTFTQTETLVSMTLRVWPHPCPSTDGGRKY